ncbi:MAG: ABC transporter ATP-binding protein [Cellulosilyticaceae bacterium]
MMKKFLKLLKPYYGSIFIILILLFIQAISTLYLPNLMSNIVDIGIVNGDTRYIIRIGVIMLIVALLGTIVMVIANLMSSKVAMSFSRDLRLSLFKKVETFSLLEFETLGTASLITRTTNDITQIQQVLLITLRMMVTSPLMIIGGIIMAVLKNAKLSLLLVVALPVLVAVIAIIGIRAIPLFKIMQDKLDHLNLVLRENLTGIRVIRAFNKVPFEIKRFDSANRDLTNNAIKVNKLIAILMPSMTLVLNLTSVAILWFGGISVQQTNLPVGDLIAFIQYVMQIMMSLVMLTLMFVLIPRASASWERIDEVLETPFSITDSANPTTDFELKGYVEFKNVSFAYPDSEEPTIENISFVTKPGEVTAIIGSTGSGKSSILNLIPRFYNATAGEVLIDGINVASIPQEVLRKKIGYVPQKAILFSGSVRENIQYGVKDASDEAIYHALDIAQATDFILGMEGKLDAYIAQGGTNVSGGQKQRLSIARALVRNPEIYLLDDSLSALDFKTDSALRKALKNETQHAAVIMVAQRISTIMDADTILVLNDGKIVGQGKHKELLKTCDTYLEIALSQLSKEEME